MLSRLTFGATTAHTTTTTTTTTTTNPSSALSASSAASAPPANHETPTLKSDHDVPTVSVYKFAKIKHLQLSRWNNIFGPMVDHVWIGKDDRDNPQSPTVYLARHTLNGEEAHFSSAKAAATAHAHAVGAVSSGLMVGNGDGPDGGSSVGLEHKFHVFNEISLGTSSVLFNAPVKKKLARFALTAAFDIECVTAFTRVHSIVEEVLARFARRIEKLLNRGSSNKEVFSSVRKCIRKYGVQIDRLLAIVSTNLHDPVPQRPLQPATVCPDPLFTPHMKAKVKFLQRAVTSHLQTQQCSVVVGKDPLVVEKFTRQFAILLSPRDRALYSPFCDAYVPGLVLQGLSRNSYPERKLEEVLLHARMPTTVLDIDSETVYQTVFHIFCELRTPVLDRCFGLQGKELDDRILRKLESKDVAPIVVRMLDTAASQPGPMCNTYLRLQISLLFRRALVMIQCVLGGVPTAKFSDKRLRHLLGIENAGDYLLFLSLGERLCPGFYMQMAQQSIFLLTQLECVF